MSCSKVSVCICMHAYMCCVCCADVLIVILYFEGQVSRVSSGSIIVIWVPTISGSDLWTKLVSYGIGPAVNSRIVMLTDLVPGRIAGHVRYVVCLLALTLTTVVATVATWSLESWNQGHENPSINYKHLLYVNISINKKKTDKNKNPITRFSWRIFLQIRWESCIYERQNHLKYWLPVQVTFVDARICNQPLSLANHPMCLP